MLEDFWFGVRSGNSLSSVLNLFNNRIVRWGNVRVVSQLSISKIHVNMFWIFIFLYFYYAIWHSAYIPSFIAVLLVRTLQQVPMFGKYALQFSFQLLVWYYLHSSLEICRLVSNIPFLIKRYWLAALFVDFGIKCIFYSCDLSPSTSLP